VVQIVAARAALTFIYLTLVSSTSMQGEQQYQQDSEFFAAGIHLIDTSWQSTVSVCHVSTGTKEKKVEHATH
jgi:hypothetical protein